MTAAPVSRGTDQVDSAELALADIDLSDADLFAGDDMWDSLATLRAQAPISRQTAPDGDHWALTQYRDVFAVYADTEHFASRFGMRLGSDPDAVDAVAQRMLIVSDAPEHPELKRILMRWFGPEQWPTMQRVVGGVVADVLADAVGDELDFIKVAKTLPNHVVCALMDLPRADWDWIGAITTSAFDGDGASTASNSEIFLYFMDLLEQRRRRPGDDFVSWVATRGRDGDGRALTDEEIIFNCNGVLAGANETTRYSAAGGIAAFARHPEQWARLGTLGPDGVPAAVEEILRWTTPGVHALRTVTAPVRIRDVELLPGERVSLWNLSANRDDEVFTDPDRFVVDRSPNRHLAFGRGRHLCLGARLARYELQVLITEMLSRVERIELTGALAHTRSNFTWGVERCPVRLSPRAARPIT